MDEGTESLQVAECRRAVADGDPPRCRSALRASPTRPGAPRGPGRARAGPRRSGAPADTRYARPTSRPGRDAQDLHDLVAVQVGAQGVQLLLLRPARRSGAPARRTPAAAGPPGPCSGSCSRPGSGCAAGPAGRRRRGRSGGPRSRSTRPSRPVLAVPVEAQVQLDQLADRPTTSVLNRSAVSRFRASFAPTTSWWWNETLPPGSNRRVAGLPMSCSSAASRLIRSGRSGSRDSRSIACSSTVRLCCVHVLVPVVLVPSPAAAPAAPAAPGRPVRSAPAGPVRPAAGRRAAAGQLVADPLGGDDLDPVRHVGHRLRPRSGRRRTPAGRRSGPRASSAAGRR